MVKDVPRPSVKQLKTFKLTLTQYDILAVLKKARRPMLPGDGPTINRAVKDLLERRLITRWPEDADEVRLTKAGRAVALAVVTAVTSRGKP